ncbi:serine/threonine-protein kinase [Nocardia huaxiensis]|uniref:non-specific serine/threonine protein kinase n=1 Tax=Nocardia huaxiensis TaxID=2755382 RepID=A0A7D6VAL4_9NOCA|nr:serine/threonine-protein kinase [Nocardia huaxiensis]QLY31872.1 serine/threonine protein kinase [Nocardia huaxiensis]UFS95437.1 serine/threonine protein kinase [Nocardia huaxiensis]
MAIGPGSVVGGYRIERVLGAGGMGTVFLAKHPILPRRDAIKVLSAQYSADQEFRGRFEREANLAAALDHPNVVAVYNRGEENGQLWIAMQYVDGIDAAAAMTLDQQAMTPERALRIVTEVGRGLDHAHRRGLLHRDIKPANFLLAQADGEEERVLLTDFGVAKSTDDTLELTQAGSFVATIAYASPEQLSGERVDHRADIYSLACSFFKLVTGRNPYPSTQPTRVMIGHLHEPPPRISEVNFALPPAVDQVLAVAMAKNPAERFDTCHEFTTALRQALVHGVSTLAAPTAPDSVRHFSAPASVANPIVPQATNSYTTRTEAPAPPSRGSRGSGRTGMLIGAAGLVVAVAVAGTVWALSGKGDDTATPPAAGAPSTSAAAQPTTLTDARRLYPAFEGKNIVAVDVTGDSAAMNFGAYLKPGPQSRFLEGLGFAYHQAFARSGEEPSPRTENGSSYYSELLAPVKTGYILAVRSDASAGGGGMRDLPFSMTKTTATVLVLDDPLAVEALRNWTDDSERVLLDKLLPILAKGVK